MRRLLTLYVEAEELPDEPTWNDLLAAGTNGHIQTAVILDSLVPSMSDILDALRGRGVSAARCESCGKSNAIIREKPDPKTFRAIRQLLCGPCGRRLGYGL